MSQNKGLSSPKGSCQLPKIDFRVTLNHAQTTLHPHFAKPHPLKSLIEVTHPFFFFFFFFSGKEPEPFYTPKLRREKT